MNARDGGQAKGSLTTDGKQQMSGCKRSDSCSRDE